jgi:hypothetical protein
MRTMPADRHGPIPSYCIGQRGLEPPSQVGARLSGMVIHFGVDHLGSWWTKSLVEISALVRQAYLMSK